MNRFSTPLCLASLMLAALLAACGGGSNEAVQAPQSAPEAPAAANVYELAEVQAYIRINNLVEPRQIHQAALAGGLDAGQLDSLYGLAPGTAAAYITAQGWTALPGGTTIVGLGAAQPTAIASGTMMYGRTATITVTGTNLSPSNMSVSADKCSSLTLAAGGSGTSRTLTCKVNATGALTVQVRSTAGELLRATSFVVPLPQVTIATTQGTVVMELNPDKAPITVNNFLAYTGDGFFAGTLFHRVISGFMIQGGGLTSGLAAKATTYPAIVLESNNGLANLRGTVAMARTAAANSATSQFFINHVNNAFLNYASANSPGYAVFGTVVSGMDVVDRIAALPTRTVLPYENVPQTEVVITSATQTR